MDTRSQDQRLRAGMIPGSINLPLSVLEWPVDPNSGYQNPAIGGFDDHIVLNCREGYSLSLAARRLQQLGFGAPRTYRRLPSVATCTFAGRQGR